MHAPGVTQNQGKKLNYHIEGFQESIYSQCPSEDEWVIFRREKREVFGVSPASKH
jgi:hypothetical protein